MLEFAFVLPLLIIVFYGVVELTRDILMQQKLDNATHTIVDVINQNLGLTIADLDGIADSLPAMVAPYDANGWGMIVTSVQVSDGHPIRFAVNPDKFCDGTSSGQNVTVWQHIKSDGAMLGSSKVSSGQCAIATLPDLALQPKEQVISVEVYLKYRPLIDNNYVRNMLGLTDQGVYKVSYARPRYGTFEFAPK